MEENQELLFKFSMFEQQIHQLQQQLQAIEQGILEMNSIHTSLNEIVGGVGKEILSPIGRGIFAKAKLTSEDLLVDIGDKNLVKKTIPQTKELVEEQVKKLEEIKTDINTELDRLGEEITKAMQEAEKEEKNHKHNPEHNHSHENCSCGDDCECDDEENCGCE